MNPIPEGYKVIDTGYSPRPLQAELHRKLKRFSVLVMHRRFGKTLFQLNHTIHRGLKNLLKFPQYAYLAPFRDQAKAVAWEPLKRLVEGFPEDMIDVNEAELRVDFRRPEQEDHVRIRLFGADNPRGLKGMYLDGADLDEYQDMHPVVFSEMIRPMLSDTLGNTGISRNGWCIFSGTPRGRNHFHEIYNYAMSGKDPEWFAALYKASETGYVAESELESARRTMPEELFQQEYECFKSGTLIATRRGQIPIEKIRIGDSVLTHRNRWRPVTATLSKPYSGEMIFIKAFGNQQPVESTPEHPFLVYHKETQTRTWKAAKDICVGDYLLLPKATSGPKILSGSWAKILAWYICEGSVSGNAVAFSLNPKNEAEISSVRALLEDIGYAAKWQSGSLVVNSVSFADLLTGACGSGAQNKRIPFDLISGHESVFFDELIKGDGCAIERTPGNWKDTFVTISRPLALDVQVLAGVLGRRSGISTRPAREGVIQGRKVWCKQSYQLHISRGARVSHSRMHEAFPTKLGIAFRVRETGRTTHSGQVFNLSVKQDESYVAENRAVHNCSWQAGLVGAYFSKEVTEAEKKGRFTRVPYDSGLRVDTYWDLGISDVTAVWFVQKFGLEYRMVDYFEEPDLKIPTLVEMVREKIRNEKCTVGDFWLPHDAKVRELGTGKSRQEGFISLRARPRIIPRVEDKLDSIHAARMIFSRCLFDASRCEKGIKALMNYQRKWDSKTSAYSKMPMHNFASNGADAFQQFAMAADDRDESTRNQHGTHAESSYDIFKQ